MHARIYNACNRHVVIRSSARRPAVPLSSGGLPRPASSKAPRCVIHAMQQKRPTYWTADST